jgi:hypothetical protein
VASDGGGAVVACISSESAMVGEMSAGSSSKLVVVVVIIVVATIVLLLINRRDCERRLFGRLRWCLLQVLLLRGSWRRCLPSSAQHLLLLLVQVVVCQKNEIGHKFRQCGLSSHPRPPFASFGAHYSRVAVVLCVARLSRAGPTRVRRRRLDRVWNNPYDRCY